MIRSQEVRCILLPLIVFSIGCPQAKTPADEMLTDGEQTIGSEPATTTESSTTTSSSTSPIGTGVTSDESVGTPTTGTTTDSEGETEANSCGNGELDPGEACDGEEWCTDECTVKYYCGDGHLSIEDDEECDDGDANEDGVYGKCTTECVFGPRCGDNKVQAENGEICDGTDDGNDENGDAYVGPECTPTCRFNAKLVFVTSVPHNGAFGSLEEALEKADTLCNDLGKPIVDGLVDAEGKPLQIEFRAWLSTDESSVNDRFVKYEDKMYSMRNGKVLAKSWSDLTDGTPLEAPITITENNDSITSVQVWTNTDAWGNSASPSTHCAYWTASGVGDLGMIGANGPESHLDQSWTYTPEDQGGTLPCKFPAHLYCVEQ